MLFVHISHAPARQSGEQGDDGSLNDTHSRHEKQRDTMHKTEQDGLKGIGDEQSALAHQTLQQESPEEELLPPDVFSNACTRTDGRASHPKPPNCVDSV